MDFEGNTGCCLVWRTGKIKHSGEGVQREERESAQIKPQRTEGREVVIRIIVITANY